MYLSKIAKCITLKLQNVFVLYWQMYLCTKYFFQNVFVQIAKCICSKLENFFGLKLNCKFVEYWIIFRYRGLRSEDRRMMIHSSVLSFYSLWNQKNPQKLKKSSPANHNLCRPAIDIDIDMIDIACHRA